jgi:hypothetical protein
VLSRPITIHSLTEARAAAEAAATLGAPLTLQSAPGAGAYAGIGWFEQLIAAVRADFPAVPITAVLDCGDAPEAVMTALRWLKEDGRSPIVLCFSGDAGTAERLAEMAAAVGVQIVDQLHMALDLRGNRDPVAASGTWLAETTAAKMAPS